MWLTACCGRPQVLSGFESTALRELLHRDTAWFLWVALELCKSQVRSLVLSELRQVIERQCGHDPVWLKLSEDKALARPLSISMQRHSRLVPLIADAHFDFLKGIQIGEAQP